MALTCHFRKAVRWTLVTVATAFFVGTFYLVFSPDLLNIDRENRPNGAGSSPVLACDDLSWGRHRLAVIVPFRDRFDEMMEFAPYIHRFLCAQHVRHQIFIINQVDRFR